MNKLRKISQIIEPQVAIEGARALQKERQSVRREDDLDREIVRVDEEIDRRVYVLYGLKEEEIKIVEGRE